VHETLARGDWVIIGEHCFRSGYDGQMELVSPCELADEDVSWRSKIRSYTDEELMLFRHCDYFKLRLFPLF
jgi:hypothetical protein